MKIGTACGTNDVDLIPFLWNARNEGLIDYVELYARMDATIEQLDKWRTSLLVHAVHAPHDDRAGFLGHYYEQGIRVRSYLEQFPNSIRLIIDAGTVEDNEIHKNVAEDVFVENMPYISKFGDYFQFSFPDNIPKRNICLDFAHAQISAYLNKKNEEETIEAFIDKFRPTHYHISDSSKKYTDDHSPLFEGEIMLDTFIDMIPNKKDAWLTVETDHEGENRITRMYNDIYTLNKKLSKN